MRLLRELGGWEEAYRSLKTAAGDRVVDHRPAERMEEKAPSDPELPSPVPWLRVAVQCVGFRMMGDTQSVSTRK